MAIDIASPVAFDFTPENLALYGLDPLFPGEYGAYRFQARRNGAALSLEDAVVVMSVRSRDSNAAAYLLFDRRSIDDIAGWTPTTKEIVIDVDQTSEDTESDTGTGWYALTFTPADEALLLAHRGLWYYDVRAKFTVTGQVRTLLRGRIGIPAPRTVLSQFT